MRIIGITSYSVRIVSIKSLAALASILHERSCVFAAEKLGLAQSRVRRGQFK